MPDLCLAFSLSFLILFLLLCPQTDWDQEERVKWSNNTPLPPRTNLSKTTLVMAFSFMASKVFLTLAAHYCTLGTNKLAKIIYWLIDTQHSKKTFPLELCSCSFQTLENHTQFVWARLSAMLSTSEWILKQNKDLRPTAPRRLFFKAWKSALRSHGYVRACICTGHTRSCGCWCSQWLQQVKSSNPLPLSQHFWSWQTEVL